MKTSKDIALIQMQQFCAYQDRCHSEVRSKLLKLHVYGDDLEEIMAELIQENFLDELRYAKSFARGKFRMNHWGKHKIKNELQRKQVSEYCIRKGLEEIDDEEYMTVLQDLFDKKTHQYRDKSSYEQKQKATNFLIGKGYELELIKECYSQ